MLAGAWTTASLPAGVRAEAARAMLNEVHLPWTLRLRDREPYDCRLAWRALGGCSLIACSSSPLAGSRERREIARTEGDYFGLLHVLSGRERVRQGDTSVVLGPGDLLVWDGTRPLDFAVDTALHKVTLLIPRKHLAGAGAGRDLTGAFRLDGHSGLGALLANQLAALARLAPGIPVTDAPLAADLVVDLLGRLLAPAAAPGHTGDLLARILAHVENRLDDSELTPSRVAAAFGITPRYLHMVFAASGATLAVHIRARRLARMRRDLADPRFAHLSVTEIALRWGFNDSAHASRAFRAAYGVSPSAFRASRR